MPVEHSILAVRLKTACIAINLFEIEKRCYRMISPFPEETLQAICDLMDSFLTLADWID